MREHSYSLLNHMLAQKMKQTELLERIARKRMMPIQPMADAESEDSNLQPLTSMGGTRIHG